MRLTLRDALKKKRMDPPGLAKASGVHKATVYRLLAARVGPSHDTVEKLEKALGLKPGTLTFGEKRAA